MPFILKEKGRALNHGREGGGTASKGGRGDLISFAVRKKIALNYT